jgi:molybdate transport system substrate-binding protein
MKSQVIFILSMLFSMTTFSQNKQYDPPWNPPLKSALNFTVKGVDNVPDIYGDINDPQLVVFMGGNQFMVLDDLLAAFRKKHPQYQRILVETLPPALLFEQIKAGELVIGNMRISLKPDIYTTGKSKIEENESMFSRTEAFTATKLALMVQKGNPKQIKGLLDLQNDKLRISMPDKKIEGIGKTVEEAYKKAGGEKLLQKIMVTKVRESSTFITQIHHRQSPMRILYNQSDVAPVWETEIIYQKSLGHPVDAVSIPDQYNKKSVTKAGVLRNAPHQEAANHFVDFLVSPEAQAIFKKFGFQNPLEGK